MWPIKFSGFSWLGVTVLTILVWSNLKNQTILSAGVNNLSPIVVYAEKENTKKDVLPFTQDNWLQKVQQDIASREYTSTTQLIKNTTKALTEPTIPV
jgi:hypothetical protein